MANKLSYPPQKRKWHHWLNLELLWFAVVLITFVWTNRFHLWSTTSFVLLVCGIVLALLFLRWSFSAPYNGWRQLPRKKHTLHIFPTHVEHHLGTLSHTLFFRDLKSATFYYESPNQIARIALGTGDLKGGTIQNWQNMDEIGRQLAKYLPEAVAKENQAVIHGSSLLRASVFIALTLIFSAVFVQPSLFTALSAWLIARGVVILLRRKVVPQQKALLEIVGSFLIGLGLVFVFLLADSVRQHPCGLWQRVVQQSGCVARHDTLGEILFLPDDRIALSSLLGRHVQIRPAGFAWPWSYWHKAYEAEERLEGMGYAPDKNQVIAWSNDDVLVLDANTAELIDQHRVSPPFYASDSILSPNGEWLAFPHNSQASLWQLGADEPMSWLSNMTNVIAFSPSSDYVVTGRESTISFHWVPAGDVFRTLSVEGGERVDSLVISPDEQWLGVGTNAVDHIDVWHLPTDLRQRITVTSGHFLHSFAFSPDGLRLATAMQEGEDIYVQLWQPSLEGFVAKERVDLSPERTYFDLLFWGEDYSEVAVVYGSEAIHFRVPR